MVFWLFDSIARVELRTITRVIESRSIITQDNVSVSIDAVLYFRVVDPMWFVLDVADFVFANSQIPIILS